MFNVLSGTILCHQKWKQMHNYWVWEQIFPKTNLSIVTILQDFSQLHVIFPHYTFISTKEAIFSMKYNVYCLRKYMNTCILHIKFFWPKCHLAIGLYRENVKKSSCIFLFLYLFVCFTYQVNSYGHCGTVSSPNHTFFLGKLEQAVNQ